MQPFKRTSFTFCLLLSTLFTFGQARLTYKTVQPALNIKKGESHLVSILHAKTKTEKGKAPATSSLRYSAQLTLTDSTEDELTFTWVYKFSKTAVDPASAGYMNMLEGLPLVYKTDGTGGFKELVNWQEVRNVILKVVEEAMPKTANDTANTTFEKVKAMFSTKAAVQSAFIKEIQLLHSVYGQRFSTQLEKAPTLINIPISAEPVPAIVTAQVTEMKPSYYSIKTTQAIDKEGAKTLFDEVLKKMGLTDEKTLQEAKSTLASFQMTDLVNFTINTKTGWPVKAASVRRAGVADSTQVETYELSIQ